MTHYIEVALIVNSLVMLLGGTSSWFAARFIYGDFSLLP